MRGCAILSIGYACLIVGLRDVEYKTCRMDNASETRLIELIGHNLLTLEKMIDYNITNQIQMFRITSDLIPFGSSPVNQIDWPIVFKSDFNRIGEKIRSGLIRVSMHPGQYTVLNSLDDSVVDRAIQDLVYHAKILDALNTDPSSKIILHVGGIYGDKPAAIDRFVTTYVRLPDEVKRRLVIENDDRSYTIEDVLAVSKRTGAPVVYDNLHNLLLPSEQEGDDLFWIGEAKKTWKEIDGNQKIHYSQQDPAKQNGSHSQSIQIEKFLPFYQLLDHVDVMLEVKDKNLSAIKCINCTRSDHKIKLLENEWSLYKYNVLERDPSGYQKIRVLLKDKDQYPALDFYRILEKSLAKTPTIGTMINGFQHVFGYFKNQVSESERALFFKKTDGYQTGSETAGSVKKYLEKLALKYQEEYLLKSYYFILN